MPETTRRDRRRAQRRRELYEAALELFVERGFDAVTVDDIAAAADVSKGTFFNYFPSKEHLLVEYRHELFDFIHGYGASLRGASARALFKRYFRKLARRIREQEDAYAMLFREVVARPHLVALTGRQGDYRPCFERFLRTGQEAGEVPRHADLGLLAETIRDLWGGTSTHWIVERPSASLETLITRRLDLFFDLLEAGVE